MVIYSGFFGQMSKFTQTESTVYTQYIHNIIFTTPKLNICLNKDFKLMWVFHHTTKAPD